VTSSPATPAEHRAAIPRVLSIAGTDPTGGAGIQADLKSIAANGGYGMAVVTALVAQNTQGVRSVHVPPVAFLTDQLYAVSDDVEIDAVKIGMLFDATIITAVRDFLTEVRPPIVVLDPVMVAASGDPLLAPEAADAVRDLTRLVDLVTPNLPELAVLVDSDPATDWPTALAQAAKLARSYDVRVLAKGGHLAGPDAPDALVAPDGSFTEFPGTRVATENTHGTGCSLSSAVATQQARLDDWEASVGTAKAWLHRAIAAADGLHVGHGHGPVHHFVDWWPVDVETSDQ